VCPHNKFGSGKEGRGKACSDSKRLAIVPASNLANEAYGGPMLLRVPAASLKELKAFGDLMSSQGFPTGSYQMRISFDAKESYPKFLFNAIRPLNDEESDLVLEMQGSEAVARVLADDLPAVAAPAAAPTQLFEQAPAAAPIQQAPVQQAPVQQAAPEPVKAAPIPTGFGGVAATPAAAPVEPAAPVSADAQASLDAKLDALLPA
jgi:hypothetical protein